MMPKARVSHAGIVLPVRVALCRTVDEDMRIAAQAHLAAPVA